MSIEDEIETLRQKLPTVHSNPPHILKAEENGIISIVAADRPDKAVVIGPGGYIAGHLAKIHKKPLSITAYTDEMIRDFRKTESQRLLTILKTTVTEEQSRVLTILEGLLTGRLCSDPSLTVGVALSGGRDSLASAVLLRNRVRVKGLTVYPSDIILPRHVRESLDKTIDTLAIEHQYVRADFSDIISKTLEGQIHPCGHCHQETVATLVEACTEHSISSLVLGELLPTGSQSLRLVRDVLIINLPAFLALNKRDTTDIASQIGGYAGFGLGCPLLKHAHRKFPNMKYATAKRLFREVRAGVLEPGEALNYLKPLLRMS
jgi:predicted PP-loop superfamily ATPase